MTQTATRHQDDLLPAGLSMGLVSLKTNDIKRLRSYYENALGLVPLSDHGSKVVLGRVETPLVLIEAASGLKLPSSHEAGLYHTAILFESASALAATVYRALRHDSSRFVGSSDHLVSEAFYFQDPDNNGIELYVDRPREQWEWRQGEVAMDTVYLPWDKYLNEHLTEDAASATERTAASLGHVHLQVGDVQIAHDFYVDVLGFEKTASLGKMALFVSAGGYHHHMAMNTWNSTGAGPRRNTLGLGNVRLELPSGLDAVEDRLLVAGYNPQREGDTLTVADPWNTVLVLSADS